MYYIKQGNGCGIKATLLTPSGAVADLRDARDVSAVLILPNGSTMRCEDCSVDKVVNAVFVRLSPNRELTSLGDYGIVFNVKLGDNGMYSTPILKFAEVTEDAEDIYSELYISFKLEVTDFPDNVVYTGASPKVGPRKTWLVYNDALKAYEDTGLSVVGGDGSSAIEPEVAYYDIVGKGGTSTANYEVTEIGANTTKHLVLKAITNVIFTGTDNGTFVDIYKWDAGTEENRGFIWENRADPGATYSAGAVINTCDYTFNADSVLVIRGRFTGTVQLAVSDSVEGGFDAEGKYNELSTKVGANESKIGELEDRVEEIEKNGSSSEDIAPTVLEISKTDCNGTNASVANVVATLPANITAHFTLKAVTDLTFTKGSEGVFVDLYKYDAGTTSNGGFILEQRHNVGATYSAGTIICDKDYTFTNESDVRIRGYFSGTVNLTITYGGFNVKESYDELSAKVDNNTARITSIEGQLGGTSAVVNQYKGQVARALQLGYVDSRSTSLWPIMPLVFMHISDTHKATNNTRAFEVLNYLGANGHVQFLMHTGDILEDPDRASQSRWASIVAPAQYPVMLTAGNHDVGNWLAASGQYTTTAQFHNTFITPVLNSWGLKTDGLGTPYTSGKNYYFKDFTDQKIRFVVVDEFELPDQYESDGTTLLAGRGARWISQEQADWFVYTLRTTPNGYGVIVAKHAPDGRRGDDKNPFNSPYLKGKAHQQTRQKFNDVEYTTFFADIVQAFIDKTTLSKTIQQEAGAITGSVTISADFTATTNCEFICYVTGHTHADGINFLKDYPQQLDLNINCNNTHYQHYSNLQLIAGSPYEDAINVYSVDRNNGLIHVVRIGGEYSADGDRRDILTINYRNPNATTGDFDAESAIENLSTKVTTNTTNIASLTTRMSNAENDIANHEERILDIEEGGYGGDNGGGDSGDNGGGDDNVEEIVLTKTVVGKGADDVIQKETIATIDANTTVYVTLKAATNLAYTGTDTTKTRTFVDVYRFGVGETSGGGTIWENRQLPGYTVEAGTILWQGEYTFNEAYDLAVRGRFSGEVEITVTRYVYE